MTYDKTLEAQTCAGDVRLSPAASAVPPDYCIANQLGQRDAYSWLEAHTDAPAAVGPFVCSLLAAMVTGARTLPAFPASLRVLFVGHLETGDLQARDLPCWSSGVAMGVRAAFADVIDVAARAEALVESTLLQVRNSSDPEQGRSN